MSLTAERALRAYATMMNTLDSSCLEPLLADDFHYASQWVFAEIESKKAYLEYIAPKLDAIRKSGSVVWAEMGSLDRELPGLVTTSMRTTIELLARCVNESTTLLSGRDTSMIRVLS